MAMVADLSELEKAVADSEKNVAALLARANELSAQAPVETGDPLDSRDPITSELGILPSPAVLMPMTSKKSEDTKANLITLGLVLVGGFLLYKLIK
jgi:hypothetical protein